MARARRGLRRRGGRVTSPRRCGRRRNSTYSLLVAHQLWNRGSFDLREHVGPDPDRVRFPGFRLRGFPYHLRPVGRGVRRPHLRPHDPWRVYYAFPIGTPLLAVPVVAVAQAAGAPVVDPAHGGYLVDREAQVAGWSAPFFAAAFRRRGVRGAAPRPRAPRGPCRDDRAGAGLAALGARRRACSGRTPAASCSPASRCPRSSGWRAASAPREPRSAAGCAGAYVARPTAAILVAAVGVWLALRHRRRSSASCSAPCPVLAAFAWSRPLDLGGSCCRPTTTRAGWRAGPRLPSSPGSCVSPVADLLVFLPWIVSARRARRDALAADGAPDLFVLGAAGGRGAGGGDRHLRSLVGGIRTGRAC